ncbi:MAG: PqqD family protein [Chlorobi bacterium]|nr:PqqD family protein [Chlorobiota bacterium]
MTIRKNIAVSESGFVFDPDNGDSYTLNETGKLIIDMLAEGKTEKEIKNYFTEHYDVDEGTLENNFNDFIIMLKNFNLTENE